MSRQWKVQSVVHIPIYVDSIIWRSGAYYSGLTRGSKSIELIKHDTSRLILRSYSNSYRAMESVSGSLFPSSGILTQSVETYPSDMSVVEMWGSNVNRILTVNATNVHAQ
jgi:hypothetical protein